MLTDFSSTFKFFWIGQSQNSKISDISAVCTTSFDDIHQASTFARALLAPDQVVNHMSLKNRNSLPLNEKRNVITELTYDESGDNDIADLGDFIDEMSPEERTAYEITKKLKRFLPSVPPTFREWYPTTADSFPLGLYL